MSLNKVMLIGRVGQIEIKSLEGGNGTKKCATFSLATTERYKDRSGNPVENTEWHNIVSWNHAEFCERYVQKGTQLYIEGRLRTRSWEDRNGTKRYVTEIVEEKVQLLSKKADTAAPQQQQQPQPQPVPKQSVPIPPPGEPEDDDLPFD